MSDLSFFSPKQDFTLAELIKICDVTVDGDIDQSHVISDIRPLAEANNTHVSFLANAKYLSALKETKAAAVFVAQNMVDKLPDGVIALVSKNPHRSYALATQAFYGDCKPREAFVSKSAHIDDTVEIGQNVTIGAGAVIEHHVVLGDNVSIGPNTVIRSHVQIGSKTVIDAGCVISHTHIGEGCFIGPGNKIGQAGFGYAMDPRGHVAVPQLGAVTIGDYVEIGANCTIDRGSWRNTIIGNGCVIDNLVQLGHNVELGMGCVIVSQVGISGSTTLGNFVVCAGQAGLVGHINIGDGVQIGAQAGVTKNLPAGIKVTGTPCAPVQEQLRRVATLAKLAKKK